MGLAATGICSMLGAAINVIPFMIQRNVPGIGPWVLPSYLFAAAPAILAALAYAILASAMPRAGGSYVYASRGLSPYLGFAASFSQWFGQVGAKAVHPAWPSGRRRSGLLVCLGTHPPVHPLRSVRGGVQNIQRGRLLTSGHHLARAHGPWR